MFVAFVAVVAIVSNVAIVIFLREAMTISCLRFVSSIKAKVSI